MMTYYVETPVMGVSILSDGVGKPFSVRLVAEDDLLCRFIDLRDESGGVLRAQPNISDDALLQK